jgi:hypothetical protein
VTGDNSLSPTKGQGPFRSDVKSDYYSFTLLSVTLQVRECTAPWVMHPASKQPRSSLPSSSKCCSLPGKRQRIRHRTYASNASYITPKVSFIDRGSELAARGIYIDEIVTMSYDSGNGSRNFFCWEKLILGRFGNNKSSEGVFNLRVTNLAYGCYNNSREDQIPVFSSHKEQVTQRRKVQKILRQLRYPAKNNTYITGGSIFEALPAH